jgi:hypothetical protein
MALLVGAAEGSLRSSHVTFLSEYCAEFKRLDTAGDGGSGGSGVDA